LKYFACFVPNRGTWNTLIKKAKLATDEQLEKEDWIDLNWYTLFRQGIYSSVKGMPTGIRIGDPATGWSGYWENIFIMIEDPSLKFDIGRKSIHGRVAKTHQECARKIFNEFRNYITKYVAGAVPPEPSDWRRDDVFSEIDSLVDHGFSCITFQKTPSDQEASVAAIFYECIGREYIREIIPLISGYRNRYDLYAKWKGRKVVIEFKSKLEKVTRDFQDAQKLFDEINAIVCWEVTDNDKQKLMDIGVFLEPISSSELSETQIEYLPGTTHLMNLAGITNPIYVIDLKLFLQKIQNTSSNIA
jgi:hypothetical protein